MKTVLTKRNPPFNRMREAQRRRQSPHESRKLSGNENEIITKQGGRAEKPTNRKTAVTDRRQNKIDNFSSSNSHRPTSIPARAVPLPGGKKKEHEGTGEEMCVMMLGPVGSDSLFRTYQTNIWKGFFLPSRLISWRIFLRRNAWRWCGNHYRGAETVDKF